MKIHRILEVSIALAAISLLPSCANSTTGDHKDPAAAPAMCKVRATKIGGDIRIELPPFEPKLQEIRDAMIIVLKAYVKDTMTLAEGETKEFEIDLNAIVRMAREQNR